MKNYSQAFRTHVWRFMDERGLWPTGGNAWVAVSGGVDSMVLLHVLSRLQEKLRVNIEALSVNHRSVPHSAKALEFCREQCQRWGIPFEGIEISQEVSANREHQWRKLRREAFGQVLSAHDLLYQGHHLDDSLEWSLLGQLKSSSRDIPGIAIISGHIRRPFLCVSRAQILRYAREEGIDYMEDPTNSNLDFERNFLRHSTTPWRERFPKYLKHYALRQNARYGMPQEGSFQQLRDTLGGQLFWSWEGDLAGARLRKALLGGIRELSNAGRGCLSKEVDKLLAAARNPQKRGPMAFSGGVSAYWERNLIYLIGKREESIRRQSAEHLTLEEKTYEGPRELQQFYHRSPEKLTLPLALPGGGPKKWTALTLPARHPLYGPFMREDGPWTSPVRLLANPKQIPWPLQIRQYRTPVDVWGGER